MKQISKDKRRNRAVSHRRWQAHLAAQARSGLTRAEYCRNHHLSYNAMTYWQRKNAIEDKNGETCSLVPVPLLPGIPQDYLTGNRPQIQILLPGNMAVALGDDFSSSALTRLLAVLETR